MENASKPNRVQTIRANLRKVAFEELYGRFAWAYDWVSRTFFLGQWRQWQRAAAGYITGERVLEVGMGTGSLQLDLAKAGYQVWGIDFSPQMLLQARRKATRHGLSINMCRARCQALPFPDSSFDSVISTFPSDYIIDPRCLAEISRVLRPVGRVVIAPGGWLHPRGRESRILEWVSRLVYGDRTAATGVTTGPAPAEQLRSQVAARGWVGLLSGRMRQAGFEVRSTLLSNRQGSVLVVTGVKSSLTEQEKSA